VRLLSLSQIARTWWPDSAHGLEHARRSVRRLEGFSLLRRVELLVHPELPLEAPVAVWQPGSAEPSFGQVAYRLQARWKEPPQLITAVIATKAAANFFGGFARPDPRRVEQTHELHLSTIFLRLLKTNPGVNAHWVTEAWLRRQRPDAPGEKLPDALIRDPQNGDRIIEFGGAYKRPKLEAFHAFCTSRSLPYEVW
jgi:hypothetical protein